jgi:histidinol-phosphate aminotransferase
VCLSGYPIGSQGPRHTTSFSLSGEISSSSNLFFDAAARAPRNQACVALSSTTAKRKGETTVTLTSQDQKEYFRRGFTRRSFGRIATVLTAGSTLPFYDESALAQLSKVENVPADAVMINANENPLGPCKEALEAVHKIAANGGRYLYGETDKVQKLLAEQEGVKLNYVRIYAGSSGPLHQAVLAFTSPDRALVMADPGYEAGERAARYIGSKVTKVPLTKEYSHDVKAMLAAAPDAGLFYICNPNNPTGTLTSKSDIEWLVANKPRGSVVLVDEAYTHISGAPFNTDLVAADKDVMVLRTFSKIYGMAGLRAGAAIARPDLIEKMAGFSAGMLPITGMASASASLEQKTLVPERRKIIGDVRNDTLAWLAKSNFHYVPSLSNCFMVDTGRPGNEIVMAMRKEKVYIGRVWSAWPTHVRVTVGTQEEMNKFKMAFAKVMA